MQLFPQNEQENANFITTLGYFLEKLQKGNFFLQKCNIFFRIIVKMQFFPQNGQENAILNTTLEHFLEKLQKGNLF